MVTLDTMNEPQKIGIIGLGYVGLPLAVAFASKYEVVGYDIKEQRVAELKAGKDITFEVSDEDLKAVIDSKGEAGLTVSTDADDLANINFYIVTVPTPIDKYNQPVLTPLIKASETVGKLLKPGDIVVYESTVYPGVTEEICVPILEQESGMVFNKDFFAGYSPERINPGDKKHTVTDILKVTSGSTPEVAQVINEVYASIVTAGTHLAPSIKVAEAAKVIENSQRDINIAFVNELSKIFRLLDIDTQAVLEAAGTKWNFLKFTPGLVGGHCIGVDPYYLAQKAMESGYNPEIILAGRRMNDSMGNYVAQEVIKLMLAKESTIKGGKALIMGITFKENCPDTRNTRVVDVIAALKEYHLEVDVFDPWAKQDQVTAEYGLTVKNNEAELASQYDCIILAVAHDAFKQIDISKLKGEKSVVFDVKSFLPEAVIDGRL